MKHWYQSKTIWFNLITILVVVATFFGYTPNQELADDITLFLITMSPAINFALRLITNKGVSMAGVEK